MASLQYPGASFSALIPRNDDTAQRLLWKLAVITSASIGGGGVLSVPGAGTYTGTAHINFVTYHALSDTVVSSVTYADGSTFPAGATVKAGDKISGAIKSIVITSGTGQLYRYIG